MTRSNAGRHQNLLNRNTRSKNYNVGFSTVELLVSIVIAALLIGAAYQLYVTVIRSSADAKIQSTANSAAGDILQSYQSQATKPCSVQSTTPTIPANYTSDLPDSSATADISCPYGTSSNISLVKVSVSYDSGANTVTRATYVYKN